MAQYKIQRAKGVEGSTIYTYTAPGHNECVPTRLFDVDGGGANDIEGGKMIMGITYFVPGGGCDYGANPLESIYYILTGEMTLKTEDGETVLHAGDSFHCVGGVSKSVTNTGTEVCQMLVCLLPPQAK
jgi:quercetin dioxygenase-like cupin family protein